VQRENFTFHYISVVNMNVTFIKTGDVWVLDSMLYLRVARSS
jgi:hypothetical protein